MSTAKFIDGYHGTPQLVATSPRRYPFAQNGDLTTAEYTKTYRVRPDSWSPTALGTEDPDETGFYLIAETPPDQPLRGLTAEFTRMYSRVPLQQTVPGHVFIPRPEIPGSFPQLLGSVLIVQPDSTVGSFDGYAMQAVLGDTGAPSVAYPDGGTYTFTYGGETTDPIAYDADAPTVESAINALTAATDRGGVTVEGSFDSASGFSVTPAPYALATLDTSSLTHGGSYVYGSVGGNYDGAGNLIGYRQYPVINSDGAITGGTFTITIFGETTDPIDYNASAGDVQSALNDLAEVEARGNCTVTLPPGQTSIHTGASIRFNITFAFAALTASAASLTPAGSAIAVVAGVAGYTATFSAPRAARTLVVPAHGITASDTLYVKAGSNYHVAIPAASFTVPDADTIALGVGSGAAFADASSITEVGKRTKAAYKPGTALTRVKRVTDFYLPGITPGIATMDDIPLPVYEGDAASLLQAIFAGSTSINYEVGELSQWRESPILMRTVTTLDASKI